MILVAQKILNKTSKFRPNASKILKSLFQNWHKIPFLLHFHVSSFINNMYKWINFFMWCIYILSFKLIKNWSNWSKALLSFFVFLCFELYTLKKSIFWYISCSVKKGVLENGCLQGCQQLKRAVAPWSVKGYKPLIPKSFPHY